MKLTIFYTAAALMLFSVPALSQTSGRDWAAQEIQKLTDQELQQSEALTAKLSDAQFLKEATDRMRQKLKDPASAVVTNTRILRRNGARYVCGFVNAKNSFGGFVGAQPFIANWMGNFMPDGPEDTVFPIVFRHYCE